MRIRGFSVIELLFAIAILSVAISIVVISFSKLNSSKALKQSASLITSVLNEARSLTLSSANGSQYGVHFESSQVVLFKGASFSPADPLNIPTEINPLVGIGDVELSGGGTNVVFRRLTGETAESGTIELFLKSSPETLLIITINAAGLAEISL